MGLRYGEDKIVDIRLFMVKVHHDAVSVTDNSRGITASSIPHHNLVHYSIGEPVAPRRSSATAATATDSVTRGGGGYAVVR